MTEEAKGLPWLVFGYGDCVVRPDDWLSLTDGEANDMWVLEMLPGGIL